MTAALERNLPALVVLTPLLMAVIVALCGRGLRSWLLTTATTSGLLGLVVWLAGRVLASRTVSYTFGGWDPVTLEGTIGTVAIGIEYRIDALNALVLLVIAVIAAVVTPYARLSIDQEIPADRRHFFYATYLLCLAGLLGITITGDAFNLYVLLEISSLTTYGLVSMGKGRDRRALTASFNYLIMGTVGASFLLIGIGYLFMVTGTLNMEEMARQLATIGPNRTVTTAFGLILVGLMIKMALFPLHGWLPNAYAYAPTAVTALLASTATKVGIYVALRFFFTIFGPAFALEHFAEEVVVVLACAAILHGSLMAIQQTDVKRLLAFSSVAQIGYMVLGIGLHNEAGLTGTMLHLLNHALVKGALFLGVGAVLYRTGTVQLSGLRGLWKRMPLTAAALTLSLIGLVGVPLTGGYISKWYLVSGAIALDRWGVAAVILVGSLLAVVYALRMLEPMVFGSADEEEAIAEAPPSLLIPTWALALGTLGFGIWGGGESIQGLVAAAVAAMRGGA